MFSILQRREIDGADLRERYWLEADRLMAQILVVKYTFPFGKPTDIAYTCESVSLSKEAFVYIACVKAPCLS